jgi:fumarylacetoacetase
MKTWLDIPQNSDYSIHNLPYGMFDKDGKATPGIAVGDYIINLRACAESGMLDSSGIAQSVFDSNVLNDFIDQGRKKTSAVRNIIQNQLKEPSSILHLNRTKLIEDRLNAKMYMPVTIGDYTDFYSSIEHATNVGKMFRPDNPLLPNWKHIPVGYHGRSSSIVISGTDLHRPKGQLMPPDATTPIFGESKRMDFELEMAFIIGKSTNLGDAVSTEKAEDHIFGMVAFNDWSARDIQKWEYVPLGPFLGKNFGSTISPWIIPIEALEPFRTSGPGQDPKPLSYLETTGEKAFDIRLEVSITPEDGEENIVCRSNFKYLYWSMSQQLAHHTVNGCNIKVGDMMASGTISGPGKGSFGSMLEISWGGKEPITLGDGSKRTFINDHDTVSVKAYCEKGDVRIGFGECIGKVLPSK